MMWERPIQHSIRPDRHESRPFRGRDRASLSCRSSNVRPRTIRSTRRNFWPARRTNRANNFRMRPSMSRMAEPLPRLLACKTRAGAGFKETDRPVAATDCLDRPADKPTLEIERSLPGLGSALSALEDGFNGTLFALALSATLKETDDPWDAADKVFRGGPAPAGRRRLPDAAKRWAYLHKEEPRRAALLRLLSRFELTPRPSGPVVRKQRT